MPIPISAAEPAQFVAGNTVKWSKTFDGFFASDGWALSYVFFKADAKFTAAGVVDGDGFTVTIDAETSAGIDPGVYSYQADVVKDSERQTANIGKIEVLPGFAAITEDGFDDRSFAKKMIDALEALLPELAAKGAASYSINGRSRTYYSKEELRADLNYWKAIYSQEERKAGRMRSRVIRPRLL